MSNGQPSQPEESSSLRDRIVDILGPGSSRGPSTNHNHEPSDGSSEGHENDGFNETSRLLEDYDRRHSVCGMRSCNHGTFSPKPEQQEQSSLAGSYLWGTRTPGFMASGLQTPITDGTSVTNRLAAEMDPKDRRRMYTPSSARWYGLAQYLWLTIFIGISLIMYPFLTGPPNTVGSSSEGI